MAPRPDDRESRQLARLRAMARVGAQAKSGRWRAPSDTLDAVLNGVKLTWHAHTVQLWRGAALVRTYTFAECVRDACTGFIHITQDACEAAVCIALDRLLYVHVPRLGHTYTVPLLFCVARLWPLHTGVLLLRDDDVMPLAYYVRSVFDEAAPWTRAMALQHDGAHPIVQGPTTPFPERGEQIVWASDGRTCEPALLVSFSCERRVLRVYHYVTASEPLQQRMAPRTRAAPPPAAGGVRARKSMRRSSRVSEPGGARRASEYGLSLLDVPGPEQDAALLGRRATSSLTDTEMVPTPEAPHPLFAHLAHAHAYTVLLEEIKVPELARAPEVQVFWYYERLYLFVRASERVFCRTVGPGPTLQAPHHTEADAVFAACDVACVSLLRKNDALLHIDAQHTAWLVCGPPGPAASVPWAHDATRVRCEHDAELLVRGTWEAHPVSARPSDTLAARVLDAFSLALPVSAASALLAQWAHAPCTWAGLVHVLRLDEAVTGAERTCETAAHALLVSLGYAAPSSSPAPTAPTSEAPEALDAHIAIVLHFLAQDAMIDLERRRTDAPRLVALLLPLLARLGWGAWLDAWSRWYPVRPVSLVDGGPCAPPGVYETLHAALQGEPCSLQGLAQAVADATHTPVVRHLAQWCPLLHALLDVYSVIARGSVTDVVHALLRVRWDARTVQRLPAGLALPLEEALRTCQLDPPPHGPPSLYTLLRRADAAEAAGDVVPPPTTVRAERPCTLADGLDPLSAHVFPRDYRLAEVARMLCTTRTQTVRLPPEEAGTSPAASVLARALAERTLSQCVGRGMFRLASQTLRTTGTWRTPRVCTTVRTLPDGVVHTNTHEPAELEWPEFHNGVASALEMGAASVDSSWIFAHASDTRRGRARHAGFLLGLGLHGHLRTLGRVHAYRYLAPRHTLTTIGLVLGLAASLIGTGDPVARQVMAVQAAAFLPAGSVPLHMAPLTQSAGLLGMGLVFCGTDHRWTAARLAAELDAPLDTGEALDQHRDVYAHCAGLALGLVHLGRARRTGMTSATDLKLKARLCRLLAPSDDTPPLVAVRSAASASLALALLFLRSGRRDVAEALAPLTLEALAHVRPDLLFVRALARALILWDATPDEAWLRRTCPALVDPASLDTHQALAFYHVRAGACLALGLQYAGTGDERVRALLLRQLAYTAEPEESYEVRLTRAAITTLHDVVHLALGCVMAGTGDVETLRVLRAAHGALDVPYGSHMATHMALGLLFLGGGRFSVGRSDRAIAALLMACLPRFPRAPDDTGAHLPALRHLWKLAVAPRLLAARDVTSGDVCFLPVSVGDVRLMTPALVPTEALADHAMAVSNSRRYWPASVPLRPGAPLSVHWLPVQRRTGFLTYADDPHGHRSIFARTAQCTTPHWGGEAKSARHLQDLRVLVQGFDTAPEVRGLVHYVCGASAPFATFCASILLDGLLRDAPMLPRVYVSLWAGWQEVEAADRVLLVEDVHLLRALYRSPADGRLRGARDRLVPRDVLDSLAWHLTQQLSPSTEAVAAYLRGAPLERHAAWALALFEAPSAADLAQLRARFVATPHVLATRVLRRLLRQERLVQQCVASWALCTD
ncbi:Anaphase-promoting complex subunit 1 [Malassezia nana]|uniref:Anaphase-promoting complex subunit 1 n=1 Tax=Malassezia nana TaxID=180528 RepID=A0AAF0J2Z0_9BASI|nr:Anaphase-promoting complex subunit 1 [Malassezia nana]